MKKIIQQLQTNQLSTLSLLICTIGLMILIYLHLTPLTFLPTIYHTIFYLIKDELERQAKGTSLRICLYQPNSLILYINILIAGLGIGSCYHVNKQGDNQRFIERFICLWFVISVPLIVLSLILYSGSLVGAGWYVVKQFPELFTKTKGMFISFKNLFKFIKALTVIGFFHSKLQELERAYQFFNLINIVSHYWYLAAQIGSILTTTVSFIMMRAKFKVITTFTQHKDSV